MKGEHSPLEKVKLMAAIGAPTRWFFPSDSHHKNKEKRTKKSQK